MRVEFSLLLLFLAGCDAATPPPTPPPPPTVTVALPATRALTSYYHVTGTIEPSQFVEVRPQVSGIVTKVTDNEGRFVDAGEVLFTIDARSYEADLARADAELEMRRAERDLSQIRLTRLREAFSQDAASEIEVIAAEAELAKAEAAVNVAAANQQAAQLQVEFTTLTSPIDGRLSRVNVDRGNLVGPSDSTPLTTILQSDPAYASFTVDEATLVRLSAEARERGEATNGELAAPVELAIGSSADFDYAGIIDFAQSEIDSDTGTIELRATFDNTDYALIPGMFVRLRFPLGKPTDGLLVPELALGTDQRGQYLFVVTKDDTVEQRHVTTGQLISGLREIKNGLDENDRVVVDGFVRCRPGITVDPQAETSRIRPDGP